MRKLFYTILALGVSALTGIVSYEKGFMKAWRTHGEDFRYGQAGLRIATITAGMQKYHEYYQRWPQAWLADSDRYLTGEKQNELTDMLLGNRSSNNPNAILFLTGVNSWLSNGVILDPWGKSFSIVIDADGDGSCQTKEWGTIKDVRLAVWTYGRGPVKSWDKRP